MLTLTQNMEIVIMVVMPLRQMTGIFFTVVAGLRLVKHHKAQMQITPLIILRTVRSTRKFIVPTVFKIQEYENGRNGFMAQKAQRRQPILQTTRKKHLIFKSLSTD